MTKTGDASVLEVKHLTAAVRKLWKVIAVFAVLAVVLTILVVNVSFKTRDGPDRDIVKNGDSDGPRVNVDRRAVGAAVAPESYKYNIKYEGTNVEDSPAKTFSDLDYVLMGYDILKGFPLAVGHDPGFTRPIFVGDYSDDLQTADAIWNIPRGVYAVPDVSCVTSFSSEIVKSSRSLSKSMEASASVSGGGWGVSFSASAEYREASSEVSSGEYILIISKAQCKYYFIGLIDDSPPQFHPAFINWIIRLNNSIGGPEYIGFYEKYGTHFASTALFGASFTFEHRMKATDYETMSSSGVDVAVSASYDGVVSVEGSASLSKEQQAAARAFKEKVTTKTITIGSPPPENGDALTWASKVAEYPVPVKYSLTSIEDLFTKSFMGPQSSLAKYNIDYEKIRATIMTSKRNYCKKLQALGLVDDCADYISGFTLEKSKLAGKPERYSNIKSLSKCIDLCYDLANCEAVDFCEKCTNADGDYHVCRVYAGSNVTSGSRDDKWSTTILLPTMQKPMSLRFTGISGRERALTTNAKIGNVTACSELCSQDHFCVAFTFCHCPKMRHQCKLYSDAFSLKADPDTQLHFQNPGTSLRKRKLYENNFLWQGRKCNSSSDCQTGLTCTLGRCQCPMWWMYSVKEDTCVETCTSYDKSMHGPYQVYYGMPKILDSRLRGRIDGEHIADFESCYRLCAERPTCKALRYYPEGNATIVHRCYLFNTWNLNMEQYPTGPHDVYAQKACQIS